MSRQQRSNRTAKPDRSVRGRRVLILLALSLLVLAILLLSPWGRGMFALCARQMAARQIRAGAITTARQWLAWSAWLDPDDGRTDLIEAACCRHLKQADRFVRALGLAERKGAPAARVRQELKLGMIQAGKLDERAEHQIGAMIEAGVSPHEVVAAFVAGLLVRDQPEEAKRVLDAWAADCPKEPQVAYLRGIYWQWLDEPPRAEREFHVALARQPRHELARLALAELIEEQDRPQEAFQRYLESAICFPASETAQVGVARLLRKLGGLDEARAVLEPLVSRPEASPAIAVEMAQIELESANYEQANRWFQRAGLDRIEDRNVLRAGATALALRGETVLADRLFARADASHRRSRRINDLRVRLTIDPNDTKAADELEHLFPPLKPASAGEESPRTEEASNDRRPSAATPAADLYALHCSACHGPEGDGNGRAARHLFPRPRDLRTDKSRLVSTRNGVATLDDLEAVIRRGMPGTSMPAFDKLSDEQRKLLAQEVLRLNRQGIRERLVDVLKKEGEEIEDDELRRLVELWTTPGEVVHVPPISPADSQAVARGKDAYFKLGCHHCHGDDGGGAWDMPLLDDKGLPSLPRDLVHEPFKGGQEPQSIYLRLFAGMPGTPHPGCWSVPQDQLVDLVQYCRQLSREPKRTLTNHERANQASRRARLAALAWPAAP